MPKNKSRGLFSQLTHGLVWTLYSMAAFSGQLVRGKQETEEESSLVPASFPAYYSPTTLQFMQESDSLEDFNAQNYSADALIHIAKHFLSQDNEESWMVGAFAMTVYVAKYLDDEHVFDNTGNKIPVLLPNGREGFFYESGILSMGHHSAFNMKKWIEDEGTFGSAPFLSVLNSRSEMLIGRGANPSPMTYLGGLVDNQCLALMFRHPYRLHQDIIHAEVDSKVDREIMKKIVNLSDRMYGMRKGDKHPRVNTELHEIMEMIKNMQRYYVQNGYEAHLDKVARIDDSQVSGVVLTITEAINKHALALQDIFRRYEEHEITEEEFNAELERLGGPENVLLIQFNALLKENYTEVAVSLFIIIAPALLYALYYNRKTVHERITRLIAYLNTLIMRPEPQAEYAEWVFAKKIKMKPVRNYAAAGETVTSMTDSTTIPAKSNLPKSPTSDQIKLFKKTYHEIVGTLPENCKNKLDKKALANTLDENKNDYFGGDPLVLNTQKLAKFILELAKVPSNQQDELVKPYLFVEKKVEVSAPVSRSMMMTPEAAPPVQKQKTVLRQFQFIAPNPVRSYEAFLECKSDLLSLCQEIMAYADVDDENKRKVNTVLVLNDVRLIRHGMVHREMFIDTDPQIKMVFYRSVLNKLSTAWPLRQDFPVGQPIVLGSDHLLYGIFQASNTAWLDDRSKNQIDSLAEGANLIRARKAQLEDPNLSDKAKAMLQFEMGEIYKQLDDSGYGLIDEDARAAIHERGKYAHPLLK